jgi:hypothetical protein
MSSKKNVCSILLRCPDILQARASAENLASLRFIDLAHPLFFLDICQAGAGGGPGALSLRDFVFAKEVRAGTYAADAAPAGGGGGGGGGAAGGHATLPPAATVDAQRRRRDPRAGALYCERVRYVVVCGPPGSRLVDLVAEPQELLGAGGRLRINAAYYITKARSPPCLRSHFLSLSLVLALFISFSFFFFSLISLSLSLSLSVSFPL